MKVPVSEIFLQMLEKIIKKMSVSVRKRRKRYKQWKEKFRVMTSSDF